jgi:hypothetical protein
MTAVQMTFWLQLLEGIAAIVIPATLVTFATWAKAHFKLANGSNAANILDLLVTSSSQAVSAAIAKAPTTAAAVTIKNATVAAILSDLSDSTKAAMALKGVTADTIAARIDGALAQAVTPTPAATIAATGEKS